MEASWSLEIHVEAEGERWEGVRVQRLSGREEIGVPFVFELDVVLDADTELAGRAHPGTEISIVVERDRAEVRRIHGMIDRIRDRLEMLGELRTYRLRVVPRTHQLALVETQEIVLDATVPEVIQKKLEAHGFGPGDFELRLTGTYPAREIVVQHGESDLAFVSRLAEHVGISFYLEHEGGKDKLIATDHGAGFSRIEGFDAVPFRGRGDRIDVHRLEVVDDLVPGRVFVQDYNYRTPLADPTSSHDVDDEGVGGIVEYGPHVKSPEEAARIAQVRAEEILSRKRVFEGEAAWPNLSAGRRVSLLDHPRLDAREDLLVVRAVHEARVPLPEEQTTDDAGWSTRFEAVSASVPFRAARRTPRPRMPGFVTGVVQPGPQGEIGGVAKLTSDGRYTVQIHFDTAPHRGAKASHPVRMAQPFAGHGNGMHFPLLPGTEVVIAFANGDPDRPIIVGALPNPVSPAPVVADEAHTHRIRSSQGVTIEFGQTVPGRS